MDLTGSIRHNGLSYSTDPNNGQVFLSSVRNSQNPGYLPSQQYQFPTTADTSPQYHHDLGYNQNVSRLEAENRQLKLQYELLSQQCNSHVLNTAATHQPTNNNSSKIEEIHDNLLKLVKLCIKDRRDMQALVHSLGEKMDAYSEEIKGRLGTIEDTLVRELGVFGGEERNDGEEIIMQPEVTLDSTGSSRSYHVSPELREADIPDNVYGTNDGGSFVTFRDIEISVNTGETKISTEELPEMNTPTIRNVRGCSTAEDSYKRKSGSGESSEQQEKRNHIYPRGGGNGAVQQLEMGTGSKIPPPPPFVPLVAGKVKQERVAHALEDDLPGENRCICGFQATTKGSMTVHVKKMGTVEPRFKCTMSNCQSRFIYPHQVKKHLVKEHKMNLPNKLFGCEKCYNLFHERTDYLNHRNGWNEICRLAPRRRRRSGIPPMATLTQSVCRPGEIQSSKQPSIVIPLMQPM